MEGAQGQVTMGGGDGGGPQRVGLMLHTDIGVRTCLVLHIVLYLSVLNLSHPKTYLEPGL